MYLALAYSCTSFLIYAEEVLAVYPWIELRWNHIFSYLFFQFWSSVVQVLVTIQMGFLIKEDKSNSQRADALFAALKDYKHKFYTYKYNFIQRPKKL